MPPPIRPGADTPVPTAAPPEGRAAEPVERRAGPVGRPHAGDPHPEAAGGSESGRRSAAVVEEANARPGSLRSASLPGDRAEAGAVEGCDAVIRGPGDPVPPRRAIPGNLDLAPGSLANHRTAIPDRDRPDPEAVAGRRGVLPGIVPAGAGGPGFRPTMRDRDRLAREVAIAAASRRRRLVSVHACPGDLAGGGAAGRRSRAPGVLRPVPRTVAGVSPIDAS